MNAYEFFKYEDTSKKTLDHIDEEEYEGDENHETGLNNEGEGLTFSTVGKNCKKRMRSIAETMNTPFYEFFMNTITMLNMACIVILQ